MRNLHKFYLITIMLLLVCASTALPVKSAPQTPVISLNLDNTVVFRGEVDDASVQSTESSLLALITKRGGATYPIYLVMDSPGGGIDAGIDFISFVKQYSNVHTITLFAASMAAGIVEGLPGQRYMAENGIIMFHRAKGGFQGQFEDGEVESRLGLAKDIVRSMEQINADRMGLSLSDYKKAVKDELWLFGPKAVQNSANDLLVGIKCSQQLIDAINTVEIQLLMFTMKFNFSKCPLLRAGKPADEQSSKFYQKNKQRVDSKFSRPLIGA